MAVMADDLPLEGRPERLVNPRHQPFSEKSTGAALPTPPETASIVA